MAFIETVPEERVQGPAAAAYAAARDRFGYLPNMVLPFSHRPEVYAAWQGLMAAVKQSMDERRYELVTLASARRLRSSYCCLAHGKILAERFLDPEDVAALAAGELPQALDDSERAVVDLAEKVVDDAASITQEDVDRLRALGLSDADVLDVVLAAALRCFWSKALDAVGVQADAEYEQQLEPELRAALTVGRSIAGARAAAT